MMDLLKRFEDDSLDDGQEYTDDEGGGGDGDGDDLERRLAGIDLGECCYFPVHRPDTRTLCRECFS